MVFCVGLTKQLDLYSDIDKIRDGISEKLGIFASLVMGFIICVAISISYGWKLSLVVLACVPVLMFCNHFVLKASFLFLNQNPPSYQKISRALDSNNPNHQGIGLILWSWFCGGGSVEVNSNCAGLWGRE